MTSSLLTPMTFRNGRTAPNRVWLAPMTNTDVESASVITASGPKTVALCTPLAGSPVLGDRMW